MKSSTWKRTKRITLLKHPRITLLEDTVLLPNGHQTDYLLHQGGMAAAMIIAKRSDGKILLQREYSYPPNKWLFQFPGGAVEKGELIEAAALRELAEEAGLSGSLEKLGHFYLNNRRSDMLHHTFLATDLSEAQALGDIEEDIESYWFSEAEIDTMIAHSEIENGSLLSGWALFKSKPPESRNSTPSS